MKSRISSKMFALGMSLLMIFSLLGVPFAPAGRALAETAAAGYQEEGVTDALNAADAASSSQSVSVTDAVYSAAEYILKQGVASEWQAIGLAQAGYKVPDSYGAELQNRVKNAGGNFSSVTDYARIALAVKAIGQDPANFAGSNLIAAIYNNEGMSGQSLNNPIYGLIALDSGSYMVPSDAKWTRDKLVQEILSAQNVDGGFPLNAGGPSGPDTTAMALAALSPYKSESAAATAGERAVQWLSAQQNTTHGGYGDSSESVSQAIIGLTSYGVDPAGSGFTKNGGNLISRLMSFRAADGSFAHMLGEGSNALATEQALQALVAYNLFSSGGDSNLYDFIDHPPAVHPLVHVSVAIEGPTASLGEGSVYGGSALDALNKLAEAKGIAVVSKTSQYGTYISEIAGIREKKYGGYDGWNYIVQRGTQWVSGYSAINDFALQDGDRLYIYYGDYSVTQLVDSVTFLPLQPKEGKPLEVTVNKKTWDWDGNPVVAAASGVTVSIGGKTAVTNDQGTASFGTDLTPGTQTLQITGYQDNAAPTVVRYTGSVTVLPKEVPVSLSVEGPQGTLAEGPVGASNALEALQRLADANHIALDITQSSFGSFISGIGGISGDMNNWWSFVVQRGGQWIYPSVGISDFELRATDKVLVYYGGYSTQVVQYLELSPSQPQPGQAFTVRVTQVQWVWNNATFSSDPVTSPAVGAKVSVGGQTAATNDQGIASFSGLSAGSYTIEVTGYQAGGAPSLVRYTQQLAISAPQAVSEATISVVGDTVKGTILPRTSVTLGTGDTPYSLLLRMLGSGKVGARTSSGGVYVYSIDGLAEFDRGAESGWKYFVNGSEPSVSADNYVLQDGNEVLWKYVTSSSETAAAGASSTAGTGPSGVAITSANTLPLSQVGATTAVSGTPMTAEKSAELAKTLAANSVSLAQLATSAGTALKDAAGEVQLQIPAGAVEGAAVTIGVQEQPSSRPELVSGLYEFTPNGTKFAKPTDLSIQIPVGTRNPQNLALAWLDENTNQWIPVPAVLDLSTGTITGKVSHFTKYAVVDRSKWEPAGSGVAADISAAAKWILSAGELSDWQAFGLARSGNALPAGYLAGVLKQISESKGEFRKVTDYERLALSVAAAGGDPRSAAGYDLVAKIYNNGNLTNQGSNGPIFALLALDSGNYSIPANAAWTKAKLVQWILDIQNTDGGFPLTKGGENNVDLTAMAVAALSGHKEEAGVQAALDKAVAWLSAQQLEDGGYKLSGEENSESVSQVIIALSAAGIGPGDARFAKTKGSLLSNLATFKRSDGGYAHTAAGGSSGLATEQALLALTAYDLYLNGKGKLYSVSVATATANAVFADENQISAWALTSVHEAYDKKWMEGVGGANPAFAPKSAITRAQFAALLVRLTGNTPAASPAVSGFDDVKSNSWYYGYVMKAKELGVIGGVTAASFKPNQSISRQDMAVMIARVYKLSPSSNSSFKDGAAIGNYALDAVNAVTEKGYMTGFGGSFDPNGVVTREMAAVVAVRLP
ncbi:Prenyltransferase and squalene oxidase repeat-containing protein [Paenibacillus sophorae]|uniref:Prenyltransferase and squalene oxidase repeat-containing protein n=1 Tax=Paenibacillus sophorae TaxID=1333845 RepID=A0A1H8T6A3_9BACL|nr:S-layer homology domain-containing protein [Paenibacillus sophorae]QWU17111.1 S-layer homology domain-containing protein [Paenibacillus sophorae]SEO86365.1 Prenyltransferase and squalene oxidase repeat-containing protein [Paenibacillus sophorae]